jgi:hypothetical protein
MHRLKIIGGLLAVLAIAAACPPCQQTCAKETDTASAQCADPLVCTCTAPSPCGTPSVCLPSNPDKASGKVANRPCCVPASKPAVCFTAAGIVPSQPSQPCCLQATPAHGTVSFTVAAPLHKCGVGEVLDKLEALKARKDALEREEKELHALLKVRLEAQAQRVGKVGGGEPTPVTQAPVGAYYEPVTSYRVTLVYDEKTKETKRVVTPVTSYVLRIGKAPQPVPHSTADLVPPSAGTLTPPCVDECPRPSDAPPSNPQKK